MDKDRIFLCHASEDKPQVIEIYRKLKSEGFKPWLDKMDLRPGEYWEKEIKKVLRHSRFIIIFFSNYSVSKRGYVQKEFKLALDTLQQIPEGQIFVIPARLEACDIPEAFDHIHYVDLFDSDGFDRVIQVIREETGSSDPDHSDNPARFKGDDRPVERVSWEDAQGFIQELNKQTGKAFRLPTEAEWEYAARGGKYSQGYLYAGSDRLKQVGWYDENSGSQTREVGLLLGNELGLCDMSGNVLEWCGDWFGENYYAECQEKGMVKDPQGPLSGSNRVLRGGSWFGDARGCRCSYRDGDAPGLRNGNIGFRLVLPFPVSV